MQTEFEAKFLDIDHNQIRTKLTAAGGMLIAPERLMRRRNLDFPGEPLAKQKSAWVRIRDEGGPVTMSYKQTNDHSVTGTQEINLNIDSFDNATEFLQALGMIQKSYQETRRESWELNGVQVELDTWPWIPPFVELEGDSESSIQKVARLLNLPWESHQAGDVSITYRHYYDITFHQILHAELTFGSVPEWLEKAKRRKEPA